MICPKCKTEYREGFTVCSDCGTQLIEDMLLTKETKLNFKYSQNSSMNSLIKYLLIAVFVMLFIFGIYFIVNSIEYAETYASHMLNGGSMDTAQYLIFLKKSIDKYLILGSILSIIGGAGTIVGIYHK